MQAAAQRAAENDGERPWRADAVAAQGEGPRRLSPPLPKPALAALRARHGLRAGTLPGGTDCAVCLRELRSMDSSGKSPEVVRLPCGGGHVFHWGCVRPWLARCSLCPTCRQEVRVRYSASEGAARAGPSRTTFLDQPRIEARLQQARRAGEAALLQHRTEEDVLRQFQQMEAGGLSLWDTFLAQGDPPARRR
mmetsp:Transcript_102877/g.286510  ORF Transcript_102877/g.286510 Transcript_102877/m.286510 type:complete len:193 (+) Transcript_102877:57-635(+)